MSLPRGIYRIHNAGVPVVMDLFNGSSADNTKITGWQFGEAINWNQLWLIEPVDGKSDTFTIRSLIAGTYMDLFGGRSDNRTPILGWHRTGTNQEWIIKHSADHRSYKMKNYASGTFADLYSGNSSNGTQICGWRGSFNDTHSHQCWFFQRMSLSSAEIRSIIGRNPQLSRYYTSYQVDAEYLILPRYLWQEIWESTGLRNKNWRKVIFDCDDFAQVMKAAVAQWGTDKCRADGFSIFCGLMFGRSQRNPRDGHAYNFTISDDHSRVLFFEPQTNEFMDNISYDAYLAYF
ncbi:Moa, A lectin from the mushroom marasmius Oreades in complex with the trisaccharide Galgalglcnac [Armillaria luteobubalina]|uniref:Moa, A lectin from the mushroom marasmius Oreades in complex with the trisaccharide Galgalglcnac n=1 Tax=Armillaria luteobubalina TaxID=153913 RepID=A0AA39PSE7_9AGAR|nr:Moa, A lectin from the mushroom marasmius Oreades in complex with the trisaccharide Galgalglcnac [Armillaria luteobubalina]